MINGNNTTFDWQKHQGGICVWSIGAFEQHSTHLPLNTDNIQADYFAKLVAEEFNAALLPNIPYGTSLEHSGFRGTISLKPETLMTIVRDIADEVEKQNFKIMIIINSHGGNFFLVPVVRDINRMDRNLKIILVAPYDFIPNNTFEKESATQYDIHASESETSVMLALKPEAVGDEFRDIKHDPDNEQLPLKQSDLTTFGVGHFNKDGALGTPSCATAEKGKKILTSLLPNMFAYIHDRINRLKTLTRYAGQGGVALRQMHPSDMPELMRLKTQAGWNQLESDWNIFLKENPAGCFVAVHNGHVTGTAATVNYNNTISWIGMVLVSPDFRRMGIATTLLNASIESLSGCSIIKLDATPEGRNVYRQLGFEDEFTLQRMRCDKVSANFAATSFANIAALTAEDIKEVDKLDSAVFGTSRLSLLKTLIENNPESSLKSINDKGSISGFCLIRQGCNYLQIGPLVAGSMETAQKLISFQVNKHKEKAFLIDIPDIHSDLQEWMAEIGFSIERPFIRMHKNSVDKTTGQPGKVESYFAICGPEFG
jgi:creatinine amidohydrolase/Fe(II)-dependent formamide hydrolase-like protein/N-acetylglutamate synthase-like GNAT family acetyltransferase